MNNNQEVPKWQQMQEHTFTVWLNERLQPQGLVINDLYDDLDDGVMLIQLLNILFNTEVTKNYNRICRMKVQKMENLKISFNYLEKVRKLKLVNLGPSDVVDHNKKMVLALIFNIIHHIQIESIKIDGISGKQGLLLWVKRHVEPLGVKVNDFAQSWKDGRAFSALTSVFTSLNFNESERQSVLDRLNNAFDAAHDELKVPKLLQASDITESSEIDEHSVLTYISSFFSRCANQDQTKKYTDIIRTAVDITSKHRDSIQKYEEGIKALSKWLNDMITTFSTSVEGKPSSELYPLIDQLQKYRKHEKPEKLANKVDLEGILNSIESSQKSNNRKTYTPISAYSIATINKLFQDMSSKEIVYEKNIMNELKKMLNSEVNIRKIERQLDIIEPFYASQQELYKALGPCKNIYICMMKLQHVNNYNSVTEVIENEYSTMMNLYQSINKEDPKCKTINNRVSSVSALRENVAQLKEAYIQYYTDLMNAYQHLDELLQTYISELYSITVYCDIYSDELQEPVIMDDISGDVANSNIEILMKKISVLKEKMNELKPTYDELRSKNYLDSSNPYQYETIYDTIQKMLNDCKNKFEENKEEIESQKSVDEIQKEFSEACNAAKEYINECTTYIGEGDLYEQKQRVDETIIEFTSTPNVFKQVEELDKMCKQNGINRNPYTSETIYTITALKEEFVRLLHRIENSLKVCILEREKEGLTPEQQKTVMDVFNYFDKDQKGYLTLDNFYQSIRGIGLNLTMPECNEVLVQHGIEVNENTHVPMEVLQDVMLAQLHSAITKDTILDAYQHLSNNKDTISDVTLTKYFGNDPCYTYMTKNMHEKGGLYDYKRFVDELFNY